MAPKGQGICYEFAATGSCKRQQCRFRHSAPGSDQAPTTKQSNQRGNYNESGRQRTLTKSEKELQSWKRGIASASTPHHLLLVKLRSFFQEARRLVDADAGVMQAVVKTLADEDGLRCIRELVEQDFDGMPNNRKGTLFSTEVLPFLETVTHPNVLSSLVLEDSVGTIYNVLFGLNGDRAAKILKFIGDVISREAIGETKSWQLEVSLLFFSRLVDLNSTALIQEHLQEEAQRFETDLIRSLRSGDTDSKLHRAKAYLERLQRRLSVGQSLTVSSSAKNTQPAVPTATFVPIRDVPGGRHDNDHADICEIKIMPTFQEIQSKSSEYLPVTDPAQWHIGGLDGLIDRNFRLLREDTVGQLRDAVHQFISQQNPHLSSKAVLRKNVYCDAQATKIDFDPLSGFQFELKFPQPTGLKGKSAQLRETWWQDSKRLQSGALVCLVAHRNMVLFCTVAENTVPRKSKDSADRAPPRTGSLWGDSKLASVVLTLVYSGTTNLKFILDLFSSKMTASLVEFPGVLLGAFEPTLEALKQMKCAGNVPFAELLVAWNRGNLISNPIPPPVYSLAPGFAYNLRCLMSNDANFYVHPNRPTNLQALCDNSSLDHSQVQALISCLQRRLALIQGPPGTGKSYTGVALVKVLLANLPRQHECTGPIICVTFTNHALDQLLEAFLDNKITTRIVRIGSQSKSTKLAPFNLNTIAGEVKRTKLEKKLSWMAHRDMDECERDFRGLGLKSNLEDRVVPHIRQYYPDHYQQLFGTDDEGFQFVTNARPSSAIKNWVDSGISESTPSRPVNQLRGTNVFEMSQQERQKLHQHWIYEVREEIHGEIIRISRLQAGARACLTRSRDEYQLRCLSHADIVGMTTTGLARRLNMLRKLQSKVILCEEAGEVLESHLLTALLPSVEHAILIGDHQQLSPKVANYELSRSNNKGGSHYSLDLSLFERLVDSGETLTSSPMGCGHPYATLEMQRRMHPSIAQLVRDTLYPNLEDATSVSEYPEVMGMRRRLFWLDHRVPENDSPEGDGNSTSHWNSHEINMTLALVNHLVQQGEYKEQDIAVLTPYLGQLHRLRQALGKSHALMLGERDQEDLINAGFEGDTKEESKGHSTWNSSIVKESLLRVLRVATVDNFQGEEAKIVVISLVRSNPQKNCGFLRTSNRINVLLSRARYGMYIIGNSETSNHVPMWAQVIKILRQAGNIGDSLALQCPRHPDTSINVSQPDDFRRLSPEDAPKNAASPVHLVRNVFVNRHVPTAHARCHVRPLVIMFRALFDAKISSTVVCGDEDIKNREVDFILGEPYKDIDLNSNPCIFPQCGHFITMESMDAQMDIKKHYEVDENERPIAIIASLKPFSLESEGGLKLCAECRGPLRNIARYGRLVRRALLDESTKKLVLYLNREYVPLAQELPLRIQEIREATPKGPFKFPDTVQLRGSRDYQIDYMERIIGASQPKRWQKILQLRAQINGYCRRVEPAEQPFQRVHDMVVNAQRRKTTTGDFKFDNSVLQTKGILQAKALSARLDIALFSDFLTLLREVRTVQVKLLVDLQIFRKECSTFIDDAERHNRPAQQVEGHVFLAQLYALELPNSPPETTETYLKHAHNALGKARDLCSTWPGQTAGLKPEVESAEAMLRRGTFYTEVTSEERMAVINAMAKEFRGTGHWYYGRNDHPFTIGECGGAMQLASCPECGAPVGGQNHQAAEGVTRANDLEATLVVGFTELGL
ncbi:NFX1-type zinc finger-containing protein 1 [Penicillium rolfsii]|nr:NFX1-type zinc finger-containing protein 1 [Penicillium rolfsii]